MKKNTLLSCVLKGTTELNLGGKKETNELQTLPPPADTPLRPTLERGFLLVSGDSVRDEKMAGRVLDVLDVCPQLVPQDRTKRFYDGYITVCVSYCCVNK